MTSFKAAIAEAQSWKLKGFVSNNQLVITNKSGRTVGRINADGTVAYRASGYSELEDIAAKIGVVELPKAVMATVAPTPAAQPVVATNTNRRWVKNQGWVYETGNYGMDVLSGYYEE